MNGFISWPVPRWGLNLTGRGRVDDAVASSGRYDSFIDDFEDMPNHGFDTRTERHDYELEAGLNVSLAAEVGVALPYRGRPALAVCLAVGLVWGNTGC